jgi:hypothetical protein
MNLKWQLNLKTQKIKLIRIYSNLNRLKRSKQTIQFKDFQAGLVKLTTINLLISRMKHQFIPKLTASSLLVMQVDLK